MDDIKLRTCFSFVVFTLAGMAAALLTLCVPMTRLLSYSNPLGSLFFGASMALCLWLFFALRSIRKTVIFLLGSFVAAVAGILSSIYVTGDVFGPGPSGLLTEPVAFTGGFVGAFVLVAAALSCFSNRSVGPLIQSTGWALAGGVFAALGSASGDWFERIRSQVQFMRQGELGMALNRWRGEELGLLLIWQTGMGLVIALAVWFQQKSTRAMPSSVAGDPG